MPTVLVTGANRGLGLEFARQYQAAGWQVIACCRVPEAAQALQELTLKSKEALRIERLDVGDFEQIDALAAKLDHQPIDLLLNNAGVYPDAPSSQFSEADYAIWLEAFRINTLAPIKIAQAFLPHVLRGRDKKIISITSKMGSLEDNTSGGSYLYRTSKAALNMAIKSLAIDLAPQGIIVNMLHPGWVQTDMGGPNGLITPQQSIAGLRQVIDKLTLTDSGKFYAYDGKEIPW